MTGVVIPRPLARPRVKVVLPAPTSPISSMMRAWPLAGGRFLAKLAPKSRRADSESIRYSLFGLGNMM